MWTTEALADQGVIGVYYSLKNPVQSGQIVGGGSYIGYYGWDVFGMTGDSRLAVNGIFTTSVNSSNGRFLYTWQWCYNGVHRANDAIANLPNVPMAQSKINRLMAESKTLRAFFYIRLNELFGRDGLGVPLYLEPVSPEECNRTQSPESEVWAAVIQDLTDAVNTSELPDKEARPRDGRMTKAAAYALRGKVYLMTGEYAKAISDFEAVERCGVTLFSDYKQLFKEANEEADEMIFSIQYMSLQNYGNPVQKYLGMTQAGARDSRNCWTDVRVAPAVVDLYEVVVDDNTTKPFVWSEYISNWEDYTPAERKIFFLRDTLVDGVRLPNTIVNSTRTAINAAALANSKAEYITNGNEARIQAVYENRDPRLGYNVITPYSEFLGCMSTAIQDVHMYKYRFPTPGKYYGDQASADNNLAHPDGGTWGEKGYLPSLTADASAQFIYAHRKFVGEGLEYEFREHNPIDEPLIRYADVLLMWAEALVESNDLSGAMAKVKQVRDRVGIPTMASYFANKDTARNYVRDERRREFVGEGINFFDEMRWRTLKDTKFAAKYPQHVWGESTGQVYNWPGDHWYCWPVPKSEIELNPDLERTPGWTY